MEVGKTLEVNPVEELVVNLRELDCTTFVETVLALTLTTREGGQKWDDYCQTLKTYFEHGCSATNAAAALYVHRNTLTKRLARITEICGLDPSDGKALMHFYMSSYLRAL